MKIVPFPFDTMRPMVVLGVVLAEAQVVIALRLLGMAGAAPSAQDEPVRMVTEKLDAAQEAGLAMARAIGSGRGTTAIALAGLRPIRRRTRANVKRLTRQKRVS